MTGWCNGYCMVMCISVGIVVSQLDLQTIISESDFWLGAR